MKSRTSKEPCALCSGHEWSCYEGINGDLVPVSDSHESWQPVVDYYGVWWVGGTRAFWVDECLTCGAVVS